MNLNSIILLTEITYSGPIHNNFQQHNVIHYSIEQIWDKEKI